MKNIFIRVNNQVGPFLGKSSFETDEKAGLKDNSK